MSDIIQLLPDHLANQIAAGEVIQRPSSAVKELLENAVDAGATQIQLNVNDAGKALVQVIDNGHGMSATDARMAFERHATSKIRSIEDLFQLRTMGFRGEALASIAAVAQVEVKTRKTGDELGTYILIENSEVLRQEPVQTTEGTCISMKNLFFNVPARRNFLKSNTTELRNIIEEFTRVAMAFPSIHFSLSSNGQQVYYLPAGTARQRVVQLLGQQYQSALVPLAEQTDYLTIRGFIGKPETARKTRGDQYFFVNNRFIRSAYLNHAVLSAYDDLLPRDSFPSYVLFIDLDPEHVDINVHPTKQEIKFDDEKIIYAFVQAGIKHALAQFSIAPSLDFSLNADIQQLDAISKPLTSDIEQRTQAGNLYQQFTQKHQAHRIEQSDFKHNAATEQPERIDAGPTENWQSELARLRNAMDEITTPQTQQATTDFTPLTQEDAWLTTEHLTQLNLAYIFCPTTTGFVLVSQQAAHERIVYERLQKAVFGKAMPTQSSMFPARLSLRHDDALLLKELMPDLEQLGFSIEAMNETDFVVHGTPADVATNDKYQQSLELMLEHFKHFNSEVRFSRREKLVRTLAWQQSIKAGRALSQHEMRALLAQLLQCSMPNATPNGKPTYLAYSTAQIERGFQ